MNKQIYFELKPEFYTNMEKLKADRYGNYNGVVAFYSKLLEITPDTFLNWLEESGTGYHIILEVTNHDVSPSKFYPWHSHEMNERGRQNALMYNDGVIFHGVELARCLFGA